MKKTFIIILLCFFILNVNFVFAQSNVGTDLKIKKLMEDEAKVIEPGILPNSFWYWADIFAEQIRFVFSVGKETKGQYLINVAKERLAEMRALSELNITKYADKLTTKYEDDITKAQKLLVDAREDGETLLIDKQDDLETQLILQQAKLSGVAKLAPEKYEKGVKQLVSSIGQWFKSVLSHFSQKKDQIDEKKVNMFE